MGRGLGAQLPPLPAASSLLVTRTSLFVHDIDASGLGVEGTGSGGRSWAAPRSRIATTAWTVAARCFECR